MKEKLTIAYEKPNGEVSSLDYGGNEVLPNFFNGNKQCLIFCKGVLFEHKIEYTKIVEIYTTNVIYNAYEEGLQALRDTD